LNVPGPGAYKLKSSIGDVPEYAIQGRKDEHKYVWINPISRTIDKHLRYKNNSINNITTFLF